MYSMDIRRIGIMHLNQIGDLLFALPMLASMRKFAPQAEIHSYVKPYLKELLDACGLADKIIVRNGGLRNTFQLIARVRKSRYDVFISLSRSEECLLVAACSGAALRAGFSHAPLDRFLHIREAIQGHNSWSNNARLLDRIGIPPRAHGYVGLLPRLPYHGPGPLPERFVVLSPGASSRRQAKAWNPSGFAAVADALVDRYGYAPVLVGGADCRSFNDFVLEAMLPRTRAACLNVTGSIGLCQLSALLAGADLFVGIDSVVMHMAAAHDVPVVALFGPTDPAFVAPHNRHSLIVRNEALACVPCYLQPCDHLACMESITAAQVLDACERLMVNMGGALKQ